MGCNVNTSLFPIARIQIEDKYLIPSLTSDVSLEHIIPTTRGPGVCTTILLDFLVCKHNGFLEECKTIAESENRYVSCSIFKVQFL